ncbi:HEPN domain-containing protein [Geminocystis herdmanii]|uniref:HEPN domain-containing protein n=1 Tax=Geminocystis herdmanii TaxID=669359 RepID=UPI0003488DEB|nr:HEPN domain-containing protein [Geminocystis herdmanii]
MNIKIKKLLIKAEQSLNASEYLLRGEYIDFAVARAYYAMFYLAEAFLTTKNMAFSKHSAVISAFGKEFAKTQIIPPKYHKYLKEAQDLRLVGDYDEIDMISKEEAQIQINRAREFLEFSQQELNHFCQE